jgi:hypothetical protein
MALLNPGSAPPDLNTVWQKKTNWKHHRTGMQVFKKGDCKRHSTEKNVGLSRENFWADLLDDDISYLLGEPF